MTLQHFLKKIFVFLVFICISFESAFSGENNLDSLITDYKNYVQDSIEENKVPGAAIAIVTDRQILFIKGFGVKKMGETDSVGIHTAFRIGSLSKGFAAVLSGKLAREGVFNWDDKVIKFVPDFALRDTANSNNLTIRQVLSHTSGLIAHAYDYLIEENLPLQDIIHELRTVPVICPVGKSYTYQNTVYSVIAEVIESATNREYTDLLSELVIKPLGLKNVSFSKDGLLATQNFASPHVKTYKSWRQTRIKDTYYNVPPAGGLNASVYDMALWLKCLLGGAPQVISPDVINDVCQPIIKTPYERRRFNWKRRIHSAYYGLGWRVFDYAGHPLIFHNGGLHGYLSTIAFLPKEKIGIVILLNGHSDNCFAFQFLDMYLNIEND
jgi:beta-lactamase class C